MSVKLIVQTFMHFCTKAKHE